MGSDIFFSVLWRCHVHVGTISNCHTTVVGEWILENRSPINIRWLIALSWYSYSFKSIQSVFAGFWLSVTKSLLYHDNKLNLAIVNIGTICFKDLHPPLLLGELGALNLIMFMSSKPINSILKAPSTCWYSRGQNQIIESIVKQ